MGALRDFELAGWQARPSTYDGFAARRGCSFPRWCRPRVRSRACACSTSRAARASRRRRPPMPARAYRRRFLGRHAGEAKSLYPGIEFHTGDAEALPFADARFDAAIANFGIHHVERPERAIAEARRVLKRGGTFAFTVWAAPEDNTAWRLITDAVGAAAASMCRCPPATMCVTPENFARL